MTAEVKAYLERLPESVRSEIRRLTCQGTPLGRMVVVGSWFARWTAFEIGRGLSLPVRIDPAIPEFSWYFDDVDSSGWDANGSPVEGA